MQKNVNTSLSLLKETVRRMLVEASAEDVEVIDLRPGDVFVVQQNGTERRFIVQKMYPVSRSPVMWWALDADGKREIVDDDSGSLQPPEFYSEETGKVVKDSSVLWNKRGTKVDVSLKVNDPTAKNKKSANVDIRFLFDSGPSAPKVNAALASTRAEALHNSFFMGIDVVQRVDTDPRFAVGQHTAPKGTSKNELIFQVLADAGEPLSKDDILQRVAKLEGKPYVPTSNGSYFAPSNKKSLVARGIILPVKGSKGRVLYKLAISAEKPDWRPEESIPEDYYAL